MRREAALGAELVGHLLQHHGELEVRDGRVPERHVGGRGAVVPQRALADDHVPDADVRLQGGGAPDADEDASSDARELLDADRGRRAAHPARADGDEAALVGAVHRAVLALVRNLDGVVEHVGDQLHPKRVARHQDDVADLSLGHPDVVLGPGQADRVLVDEVSHCVGTSVVVDVPGNAPLLRSRRGHRTPPTAISAEDAMQIPRMPSSRPNAATRSPPARRAWPAERPGPAGANDRAHAEARPRAGSRSRRGGGRSEPEYRVATIATGSVRVASTPSTTDHDGSCVAASRAIASCRGDRQRPAGSSGRSRRRRRSA